MCIGRFCYGIRAGGPLKAKMLGMLQELVVSLRLKKGRRGWDLVSLARSKFLTGGIVRLRFAEEAGAPG